MPLQPLHGLYFEEFAIGDNARSPTRTITEADIVAFSGISGDYNEIHSSAEYSKSQHFGQRIAHGMLGLSIATGLAFQMGFMLGTVEVFRSLEWEFTGPIFIGDTIHLNVEITDRRLLRVHVFERVAQLTRPAQHFHFGQESIAAARFIHQFFQVLAKNIVHHQVIATILGEVIRDFGKVGVIQAGEHAGFLAKLALQLVDHFRLK